MVFQYMGEKTFVKLFPDIVDNAVSVDDIKQRAEGITQNGQRQSSITKPFIG